jgi:hypothetical protein
MAFSATVTNASSPCRPRGSAATLTCFTSCTSDGAFHSCAAMAGPALVVTANVVESMRRPLTCCGSSDSSNATARRPGAATRTTAGLLFASATGATPVVPRSRSSTCRRVRG